MSFLVSGSDQTGVEKLKRIDPKIRKAINNNHSIFSKPQSKIQFEISCQPGHPLQSLQGMWLCTDHSFWGGPENREVKHWDEGITYVTRLYTFEKWDTLHQTGVELILRIRRVVLTRNDKTGARVHVQTGCINYRMYIGALPHQLCPNIS